MPFFSIILPTKNRSFIIANTIESILGQTYIDFEFIIIDNSDDLDTCNLVLTYPDVR